MELNPRVERPLPTGHDDWHQMPASPDEKGRMSKKMKQVLDDLRTELKPFLAQHPDWFYGIFTSDADTISTWHIMYWPGGWYRKIYHFPSLEISFWKNGRTPLFKGRPLVDKDKLVPAQFMETFTRPRHELVRCEMKTIEDWALTFSIISNQRPRKSRRKK